MNEINALILPYLDTKQHLWNTHFWKKVSDIRECEPLDSFDTIDERLFFVLVCYPLKIKWPENFRFGSDVFPGIVLHLKKEISDVSLLVRKDTTQNNRYWENLQLDSAGEMMLSFIDFFYWNKYDFLSAALVRCQITNLPNKPEYIGKEVLLDLHVVDFFMSP